jgi:hypothetical protein
MWCRVTAVKVIAPADKTDVTYVISRAIREILPASIINSSLNAQFSQLQIHQFSVIKTIS